jgi:hypothetical protein
VVEVVFNADRSLKNDVIMPGRSCSLVILAPDVYQMDNCLVGKMFEEVIMHEREDLGWQT